MLLVQHHIATVAREASGVGRQVRRAAEPVERRFGDLKVVVPKPAVEQSRCRHFRRMARGGRRKHSDADPRRTRLQRYCGRIACGALTTIAPWTSAGQRRAGRREGSTSVTCLGARPEVASKQAWCSRVSCCCRHMPTGSESLFTGLSGSSASTQPDRVQGQRSAPHRPARAPFHAGFFATMKTRGKASSRRPSARGG